MGLSNCAKGFIACGVCTAVFLAIMIPVGILVIAPAMGQHALNTATMQISNATVYNLPEDLTTDPNGGRIANHVELTQTAFPFSTKLHETQLIMHLPAGVPSWQGGNFTKTDLAYFKMPEQIVDHGVTRFTFDQEMDVVDPTTFVTWAFGLILGIVPSTPMWIVGKPELTALGFITMDLKLGKKLDCTFVPPTTTTATTTTMLTTTAGNVNVTTTTDPAKDLLVEMLQESISVAARRLQLPPIELACVETADMSSDEIDDVLEHFSTDVKTTSTTALTTTAPMAASMV